MTDNALRISLMTAEVIVTVPPPAGRRRASAQTEAVRLEIGGDYLRVWADVPSIECGEFFNFDPARRGPMSSKALTDIPYFPQVFRYLSEQHAANRTDPVGDYLRPVITAMETALAARDGACIYFAQADDRVKIGWSRRVATRIAQLQVGNASPLRLLGVVPGGRAKERELHGRFAHARVSGEWFEATAELLGYIATVT